MKFSTYNPVVAPQKMQSNAVQGVTMPMPHAVSPVDGSKGYSAMAAAFGQITGFLQKKQDEDDAADVMKARNEIMTSLTGQLYGENGLMTTGVGENAKGLTDRVSQAINQTFDKVAQNYNPRVRRALQGNLNENMANYQRLAGQQEGREFTRQKEVNYNSALSLNADNIAANYMNSDYIDGLLNDSMTLINYRGKDQGWSGLQLEQEKRLKVTALVGGAIDNAITDGNLDQADMLLGRYRGSMSADAVMKYDLRLRGEEGIKISREMGEDLYAKFGNDTEAARKYIYDTLSAEVETVGGGGGGSYSGNSKVDSLLSAAEQKYNLPAGLIAAVASAESGFDQGAVSPAGALGVMQLMPDTAAGLGVDPNDMAGNIEGGAMYLRQLLDTFGGDLTKAVAAYNAGPNAVKKYGGTPPYKETQDYVQKVLGAVEGYAKKPAGGGVSFDALDSDIDAEGVELAGTEPRTIGMINRANQIHKQMFGTPIWVSCTTGGHAAGTSHAKGLKADIGSDELRDNPEAREKFEAALKAEGIGAVDEYTHPSENSTGGHFDLNVTGEDWYNGTNHGGFKGGAGGGGYTRRKYSEKQLDAIWQQYNARVNDGKRQQAAATKERTDAYIGQLGSMNEAQAGELLERLRAGISTKEDSDIYSAVLSAANNKFNGAFTKKAMSGGGSGKGGSGKYQRPYIYGESGERYTQAQIRKAQRTMEKWWKAADPSNPDPVKESLQDQADEASVVLKDIGYEGGADVDAQREAYEKLQTTARNVWDEAQDYDEAVRILVEEYGWTETNAITILDALPDKE